jgi:MIP family channel proteins
VRAFARQDFYRLLAEAVGAYVLVFAGCGAIVVDQVSAGRVTHVGIALSFGLAVGIMIASLGHISGAHLNPAVTLALALGRRFPARLVLPYWVAQMSGAVLAALTLGALFGVVSGLGRTAPSESVWQAFGMEVVLTAHLVFVIACVALDSRAQPALAAPAVGGAVALAALFAGPISGASMNPARSLAPALVSGQLDHVWVYLTAPFLGGVIGIFLFSALARLAQAETAA